MGPKEFNKKLALKKATIVNLDSNEMNEIYGGDVWSKLIWSCTNCETNCGSNPCC